MGTSDIDRLIRTHLADLKTFASVDPPEVLAERAGIPVDQIIRLNANENPYGCSPRVAEALANLPLHVYPDPLQRRVRRALADYTGLDDTSIVAGAGSGELIGLLFQVFVDTGDAIIECDPTFGMYSFGARVADAEARSVPRDTNFEIDVAAVENAIDSKAKMIFINSPNNPTGNPASEEQVRPLLETGRIVVVDEAYYEFCNQTFAGLLSEYENLVVLRTTSKWAGIAGLRLGYALASPKVVNHVIDIKSPYNVSTAAEAALLASLEDADALLEKVQRIIDERDRMFSLLRGIADLKLWPSCGNYILCEFASGRALEVFEGLARRGIFVRRFGLERLEDCFRITVGTPEQTDAVIGALKELV